MSNVAIKHDGEKVRLDLLSTIALNEIAKVLTFGAKKYADHNWRKGFKWSRLLGASLRHILAFLGGEDKDPETGLSHLAHAGCCILFLLEHESTHKSLDDRYKGSTPEPIEPTKVFISATSNMDTRNFVPHVNSVSINPCLHPAVFVEVHSGNTVCHWCSTITSTNPVDKNKKPVYF